MTENEYLRKRAELQTSGAKIEVKEKAILKLDEEYRVNNAQFKALDDFYEQAAEMDDFE